ncbi:hypothetical protein GCK72_011687 [Caenorhabditis remanei]|uniref:Uncharacterized protein n=1 Tax=Caenorhabditis remanei TaxID=31234 RepID=A0A6A5H9C2_CAERE|nr:hypothetical protein GCK72_011687 [Caenorhabditis remanei]KAF1763421.1 hypothetical protein GCK72_011687 [Caenorhabditis remanei]
MATVRVPSSSIGLKSVRSNNQLDTQTKTPIGSVQIGRTPYTHPSAHFYSIFVFFVPSIATLSFFKEVYFKYIESRDRYQLTSDYNISSLFTIVFFVLCIATVLTSVFNAVTLIMIKNLDDQRLEVGTSKWGSKNELKNSIASVNNHGSARSVHWVEDCEDVQISEVARLKSGSKKEKSGKTAQKNVVVSTEPSQKISKPQCFCSSRNSSPATVRSVPPPAAITQLPESDPI